MTWGASSCPCVESIQGSMLMPVHVEREVRLLGRNLHLFQVNVSCLQEGEQEEDMAPGLTTRPRGCAGGPAGLTGPNS